MENVAKAVRRLREQFILLTYGTGLEYLEGEIGVTSTTLSRFRRGGNVTVATLAKIETWCDAHEREAV